jgi:hypothetical protein
VTYYSHPHLPICWNPHVIIRHPDRTTHCRSPYNYHLCQSCPYDPIPLSISYTIMPTSSTKRPSLEAIPGASSSSSNLQLKHHHHISPLYPLFASLVFHIVPAKLESDLGVLYQSIEDLGGRCDGLEGCRWVVTALKGRARLNRVLRKWIVCPTFPFGGPLDLVD